MEKIEKTIEEKDLEKKDLKLYFIIAFLLPYIMGIPLCIWQRKKG